MLSLPHSPHHCLALLYLLSWLNLSRQNVTLRIPSSLFMNFKSKQTWCAFLVRSDPAHCTSPFSRRTSWRVTLTWKWDILLQRAENNAVRNHSCLITHSEPHSWPFKTRRTNLCAKHSWNHFKEWFKWTIYTELGSVQRFSAVERWPNTSKVCLDICFLKEINNFIYQGHIILWKLVFHH